MTAFARKLAWLAALSSDEAAVLDSLPAVTRSVRRNREIVTEGRNCETLFVLLEGSAIRFRVLRDGRRQVLNVVLPGDCIGFPGCFFETALYSVTALTDVLGCSVPFTVLIGLFDRSPRLGAAIFWFFACEAAIFARTSDRRRPAFRA
jgi:CRP-like cAMP-binding protein